MILSGLRRNYGWASLGVVLADSSGQRGLIQPNGVQIKDETAAAMWNLVDFFTPLETIYGHQAKGNKDP